MNKFLALALVFLLTACSGTAVTQSPTSAGSVSASAPSGAEKPWSYDDQAAWEIVDGQYQSPIDIETNAVVEDDTYEALGLHYASGKVTGVEEAHHTIRATVKNASTEINGREFTLEQFHFHAQSEHTVNGKHFPMEAHFVHEASDGRYAVVGVFIKEGKANPSFGAVLDSLDTTAAPVALADLVPANPDYFHYLGSLTTPPLTENVEWYVMSAPIEASAEQIAQFTSRYAHNNRDVQNLDDRTIIEFDG